MYFIYNKLAERSPSLPASFIGKELGKPVFLLLLFLEVGSVKVQLKKDPGFRNQSHKCRLPLMRQLNQGRSL
jgi:hypothetical protein